jgi:hypothetical protein
VRRYLILWLVLFVVTLGGWYSIGVLEMGVADGTGVAPLWLRALYGVELVLLLPLGRLALALDPAVGYFNLMSLALFAVVVALNAALLTAAVWLVTARLGAFLGRHPKAGSDDNE